jgi:ribosome biogenesis GTPase
LTPRIDLAALGWDARREEERRLNPHLVPGRVAGQHRGSYDLFTEDGELRGEPSGGFMHRARGGRDGMPAVGDWVMLRPADRHLGIIEEVLERRTTLSRKTAGVVTEEQVIVANIDAVFIAMSLDRDFSLRRLERYLTLAWNGGALPVVLLTKMDQSYDLAVSLEEVASVAPGVDVVPVSAVTGEGVDRVAELVGPGTTVGLVGSSGVGKSTLVNRLAGRELMPTADTRADGRGRHTTTHRHLLRLPGLGNVIDTPGMRELQLWLDDDGLDSSFADIAELATGCRFTDCRHSSEPGCAVLAAIEHGELDRARLDAYEKQRRELAAIERKRDKRLAREESRRWGKIGREAKARARMR